MKRVNQVEVIHAGWSHRDPKGITLLEAAEFDTRLWSKPTKDDRKEISQNNASGSE